MTRDKEHDYGIDIQEKHSKSPDYDLEYKYSSEIEGTDNGSIVVYNPDADLNKKEEWIAAEPGSFNSVKEIV
jgi:hypothetical protein